MKYLCSIFFEEKNLDKLSQQEFDDLVNESLDYDDVLRKGGHLLANNALQPVKEAITIRRQGAQVAITDGPFAETREYIGGFILIEARDRDEAIRLASAIPPGRLGGVEVRPVKEMCRPDRS